MAARTSNSPVADAELSQGHADSTSETAIDDVASALLASYDQSPSAMQHVDSYELPSTHEVEAVLDQLRALIFPGFVGESLARTTPTELEDLVRERLDRVRNTLRKQLYRGLHHKKQSDQGTAELDCPHCLKKAKQIVERFLKRLVEIRRCLSDDVAAHFEGDPAASGTEEVIFCYPGLYAITVYRIAHALLQEGALIIPRIMSEIAHRETGIDIHPGATIGASFFIDHGTGIVIGETAVIGDHVRIYQGVTLGALSVSRGRMTAALAEKRHPTIEDRVIIYSGATILGGDTVIGERAVIGGNCWVTGSVAPGTVVALETGQGERRK